jgi:hypothetical protein
MELLKVGLVVDFYVSKKKYNSYKKASSLRRYVERVLKDYLQSLVGTVENGVEIRYCNITTNEFWGNDLSFINDLGYSFSNQIERREDDKLAVRVFGGEIIGIIIEKRERFENIVKEDFILMTSSAQII